MARIVILGGGVGGTCAANRLARLDRSAEIVVVDSHGDHLYQPHLVRVPLYGAPMKLAEDERKLLHSRVDLIVERVEGLELDRRCVRLESGFRLDYDGLIIATGSRLDHSRIPGAREASYNFHCRSAARNLQKALEDFKGGRILVGASALPYKFPASPFEFVLLLDEWLRKRGLREKTSLGLFAPTTTILPDGGGEKRLSALLAERNVAFYASFQPFSVDPSRRILRSEASELPFDLLVLVPPHVSQPFIRASGLINEEGWVKVNPLTLRVRDSVYAIGDTAALPCSKTGAAARLQAHVAAMNVLTEVNGKEPGDSYGGQVTCFAETGLGQALTLVSSYARSADPGEPTRVAYWKKALFGKLYFSLIRRS